MYQTPKDETLHRLCHKSTDELTSVFCSCPGRETYSRSLKSLVRDLAEEHQLRERSTLVARLQSWITEAQTGKSPGTRFLKRVKDVKLLPFGSSVMGISSRDGDLDISLEGAIRDRTISPTGKLSDAARGFKADLLSEIHEVLRRGQHFRHSKHTQLIRHAKVPVSKFVEPHTGIHCDLSIGNTTGVFKSMLLSEVLRMDTRVRDLVVIVKKWAKANRINDPANGSFNSYCLTLLVLSFAQARSPPLIPPFRELFPGLRDVVCESQKDDHVDLIHEISTFRHMAATWMEQTSGTRNTETLCELLCAFFLEFSLFATHSQLLHYTAEGVSKSNSRPTCSCWDSGFVLSAWDAKALKRYQLFVEDPFEAKDNCARTLATQDWWRIVKTLQETVNLVQEFVYAPPTLQPEKWMVLWSFLFQYEPLPQLPEAMEGAEYAIQRPKSLMPLHKECLIEHLNKFKASDKKFIAVSYSWWSKEFKQFVLNAIDLLGLFQGKGPKKKVIISKADNIKDDMVEHAVNSTLRARKAHNLVVEPYQCVMKQRLAEFLRCTIRYHKFRASYFDGETKDWLLRCVLEAGLKGKYVDGDLHLERPADLRPITLEENGALSGQRKELPLVSGSPTEDFGIVGHLEIEEHGMPSQETKLASYSPEEEDDLEEEDLWGDVNGTETCASSYGELGTSYETSHIHRYIQSSQSDSVKLQLDVASDGNVKVNCVVLKLPPKKQTPRKSRVEDLDLTAFGKEESVKVSLTTTDGHVSVKLEPSGSSCMSRGLLSELTTVAEEESRDEETGLSHHTLLSNGLYERNAEILKRVFLDLFDAMEKLQDTDSFRGEIEIDPTEYVVPVSWVRQQVRDIARHLFLEIVANNKRRRAMKIRIRKRARFEESESDDDCDYHRRSYRQDDARMAVDALYYDDRRHAKPELFDRFGPGRFARNSVDDEDHVTRCLLWIKGMKREKSMHFQSGIYPPDVMACLKERAEELGLRMEVRENTMYISVQPHIQTYDDVPKLSAAKLAALNVKVQASIKDYFVKLMMESRTRGVESFGVPTKGYFMRPEWVAKQVIEIGKRIGFEVLKERDGTVEFYTGTVAKSGLARYFSADSLQIPMPHAQPSQSLLVGNLSRSFSGGHYPNVQPLLTSHPVTIDRWANARSVGMFQEDTPFRDARTPKTSPMETPTAVTTFNRSENPAPVEGSVPRRSRRPPTNERRINVREFPKTPYWENGGCENSKNSGNYDRRGRGRGKGRRGRGRNNVRTENGKKQNGSGSNSNNGHSNNHSSNTSGQQR